MVDLEIVYGAIRIDFRQNEALRYWIYGFKHDEKVWDFDNGDLLLVTNNIDVIGALQKKIKTISSNERFCKLCFEQKKVEKFGLKCWDIPLIESISEEVTQEIFTEIHNKVLMIYPQLNWRNFHYVPPSSSIFYEICTDCYTNKDIIESNYFKKLVNQVVSEYIISRNDESILEKYLVENIELIEKGMTFIKSQIRIANGIIDILAKDINNKFCVIELKTNSIDKNVVWQAASYQTDFPKDVRVIIIARKYTKGISKALENVRNTELKFYQLDNENLLQIKDYQDEVKFVTEDAFLVNN